MLFSLRRVYPFKKDQKILQFLDNFNDHNSNDDEMWERSKEIKPSGNRWVGGHHVITDCLWLVQK